jgi:hypothetical protein
MLRRISIVFLALTQQAASAPGPDEAAIRAIVADWHLTATGAAALDALGSGPTGGAEPDVDAQT